ncbi:hypothetical protein V7S43_013593 [Phytophthora oleae]|uniref:SWIM-type domain-containing protein n=1 Tax=Phytophthora oleae TaxID=2107226 RepID=A0ABD3F7E3_9STRA
MSMKLPCCHAIAYRKVKKASGTLIPWNRIDERWTSPSRELNKIKQFSYEVFQSTGPGLGSTNVRTQSDRYREDVRATHLTACEMAGIEDEAEFSDMLSLF